MDPRTPIPTLVEPRYRLGCGKVCIESSVCRITSDTRGNGEIARIATGILPLTSSESGGCRKSYPLESCYDPLNHRLASGASLFVASSGNS